MDLPAFSKNLCGLLWYYPAIDDGVKMNFPILALDIQDIVGGDTEEVLEC